MSSRMTPLDPDREAFIISEFVDMYIAAGGQMPSYRDIKKNNLISEEEVNTLRRMNLIREPDIRRAAEKKTGKKFISPDERRKMQQKQKFQQQKNAKELEKAGLSCEETEKVAEEALETAKVAEKEAEEMSFVDTQKDEKLKSVIRKFAEENKCWPTDRQIHEFSKQGLEGWKSPIECNRRFGPRKEWPQQIFPEGLPEGFITDNRSKNKSPSMRKAAQKAKKPITKAPPLTSALTSISPTGDKDIIIPVKITVPEGVEISGTISLTLTVNI